jgi:hypothetical protein
MDFLLQCARAVGTTPIMHLASLHVDVHLIKIIEPVDRFNLVLSGILKGLENVDQRINLQQR